MANDEKLMSDARKALIGGVIAIVLSPISITLAYFLGQKLDSPELSITNIEQRFSTIKPNNIQIPDSIRTPINANGEIRMLLEQFEIDDIAEEKELTKGEADEVNEGLSNVKEIYAESRSIIQNNINAIEKWDGKSQLNLEPMNPQMLGGRTIEQMVNTNRNEALNTLRNLLTTINKRMKVIQNYLNIVKPFIDEKVDSARIGDVVLSVGILNSGKTDAVIFPNVDLTFQNKKLLFEAKQYTVVNAHSFKLIHLELSKDKNILNDVNEWKALIKNHNTEAFQLEFASSDKKIGYRTQLEAR
jgi:hypothetical protein